MESHCIKYANGILISLSDEPDVNNKGLKEFATSHKKDFWPRRRAERSHEMRTVKLLGVLTDEKL